MTNTATGGCIDIVIGNMMLFQLSYSTILEMFVCGLLHYVTFVEIILLILHCEAREMKI